jgi:hypothetical protein
MYKPMVFYTISLPEAFMFAATQTLPPNVNLASPLPPTHAENRRIVE